MAAAYLDRFEELNDEKWVGSNGQVYVIQAASGDPYGAGGQGLNFAGGTNQGYSSDFAMAVNLGGALGDSSWIEGREEEPLTVAYHFFRDPFAPFGDGAVIVPTTEEFVVNVSGTNTIVKLANEEGVNDLLVPANAIDLPEQFSSLSEAVNQRNETYKTQQITYPIGGDDQIQLSYDNMYPFLTAGIEDQSGLYNWVDTNRLKLVVAFSNSQVDGNPLLLRSARDIIDGEADGNPNFANPAGAKIYIDTIMAHFIPRACQGLQLESCLITVGTEDLVDAQTIGFKVFPNPAGSYVNLETAAGHPMEEVHLFDMEGRLLRVFPNVNSTTYRLERGSLPVGHYLARVRLDGGVSVQRVVFQ